MSVVTGGEGRARVPDEFIPEWPQFIASPCPGCGGEVAPPGSAPDQHGKVLYEHRDDSDFWYSDLEIDPGNWHLRCAVEASPLVEVRGFLECPGCGMGSPFKPVDAPTGTRFCTECKRNRDMATKGGGRA